MFFVSKGNLLDVFLCFYFININITEIPTVKLHRCLKRSGYYKCLVFNSYLVYNVQFVLATEKYHSFVKIYFHSVCVGRGVCVCVCVCGCVCVCVCLPSDCVVFYCETQPLNM